MRIIFALILAIGFAGQVFAQTSITEGNISFYLKKREALLNDSSVDLMKMSSHIGSVVKKSIILHDSGQYKSGLDNLQELKIYGELNDIPVFSVQNLRAAFYEKLDDPSKAKEYKARASALMAILLMRIGSGATPDDPLKVIMTQDVIDWGLLRGTSLTDVKSFIHKDKNIQEAKYIDRETKGIKAIYFIFDDRVIAKDNAKFRLFDPFPLEKMTPEMKSSFAAAREKRQRFLDDTSFNYTELMFSVKSKTRESAGLTSAGKFPEAFAKLKELEAYRPIEDIPTTDVLSLYSNLQGQLGNKAKNQEMRNLIVPALVLNLRL
jgi:hypothetical protein